MQLIGQHPELTLDPRMRMAARLAECGASEEELGRLRELLGIRDAWLSRYPHELSGGELQRFCIARALGAHPSYLIADEVSTMLDAVTQAQIWRALVAEAEARAMGLIFVSHSPALASRLATRVVELPTVPDVYKRQVHGRGRVVGRRPVGHGGRGLHLGGAGRGEMCIRDSLR